MGSYVIVINAEKVKVTGKKYTNKYYFRHTQNKRSGAGRIGGYRLEYFNEMQKRLPERIVEKAVFGMLPKGRLGKDMRIKQLKVSFQADAGIQGCGTSLRVTKAS